MSETATAAPQGPTAIPVLVAIVVAVSLAAAFFGERGIVANDKLAIEIEAKNEALAERRETIAHLSREIERMKGDPSLQEWWVRQELGYVREGEVLYLFPGDRARDLALLGDRQLEPARTSIGSGRP